MTINIDQLRGTHRTGDAMEIYNEVKREGNFLDFARKYIYNEDCNVVKKALWGLTKTNKEEIKQLQEFLNEFMDLTLHTCSPSIRRLSLTIVERLEITRDSIRTDFLNFCLEHMILPDEPSATQALCMKLAFRMCRFYPELINEFICTIDNMEEAYYKPAVKNVRKRILNKKMKY